MVKTGKKSIFLLMISIVCVLSISTIVNTNTKENISLDDELYTSIQVTWASKEFAELTYEKLFHDRDIVSVVEIMGYVKTYRIEDRLPVSIYKANVIDVLKGEKLEVIYIYQMGIYNPKENQVLHVDGTPEFASGSKWLLFMNEVGYEKNLKIEMPNVYYAGSLEAIRIINDTLTVSQEAETIFPNCKEVIGLTLSEFMKRYIP